VHPAIDGVFEVSKINTKGIILFHLYSIIIEKMLLLKPTIVEDFVAFTKKVDKKSADTISNPKEKLIEECIKFM